MKKEIWRTIKQNKRYQVSSLGRVKIKETGRILSISKSNSGGLLVNLYNPNTQKQTLKSVARLMMLAFKKKPPKFTPTFKDGDNTNVTLSNLKRGTRSENLFNIRTRKNKLRGVIRDNNKYKYFRAYISLGNGKSKTLGYFKKRKDAYVAYYNTYTKMYKVEPFDKGLIK